jgi:hypothetical protein
MVCETPPIRTRQLGSSALSAVYAFIPSCGVQYGLSSGSFQISQYMTWCL